MTDALAYDEALSATKGQDGSGLLTTDGRAQPARFHPLAQLFPMIEGEAFAALVEDVRENGVRRPVVMFEGMILDGRNRYMAAREAEVGFPVVDFVGDDPVAFVISENIHRRHLTDSQRAMVGARLAKMNRADTLVQNRSADLPIGPSTAQAADQMQVSTRMVGAARAVVRDGSAELVAAVDAGAVTVSAAAEVSKLPEAAQAEIVAAGAEAVRETARAIREDASVVDRVNAGASVAEARKPKAEPAEPVDPERRLITKLTPEAMIDEIVGLRADLREFKDKNKALRNEVADLKAKLTEAISSDMGKALGNAQRRADTATGRMNEHMATAKRLEFKLKKAEARVAELEAMPVSMT
jgi:hypothetical protein